LWPGAEGQAAHKTGQESKSMSARPTGQPHTEAVSLQIRGDIRMLIDRAAKTQGKSRSAFMIDAARRAAEQALLDQTLIRVDPADFDRFVTLLDSPPDADKFARLMNATRPWTV
jgi:uncharacterized protein (DUF1778 family)